MLRASVREVLLLPVLLCAGMVLCAIVTGELAGVTATSLYAPYLLTSLAITFLSVLVSLFCWLAQLARTRADEPLRRVRETLFDRAPYLVLPAAVFPLFLASFTATKTAIPFLVGYSWDPVWAEADRLIFGADAWRIAHRWIGSSFSSPLEWFYSVAWGLGLVFIMSLVPLNATPRFTGKFYTAMMATWLIGGVFMAYAISAAGPIFAPLFDPQLAGSIGALRRDLQSTLPMDSPIRETQNYLASAVASHVAVKGGGISAMPSMHVAAVTIYVLAARHTRCFAPALMFWAIIFICSAYSGYHYWIDGLVATAVACLCWASASPLMEISQRMLTRALADKQPHCLPAER